MTASVTIEIVGFTESECSPFPCDENRTCGLLTCAPSGSLLKAFDALKYEVKKEFGECVSLKLTLLDDEVPEYIRDIYEQDHPAIPMVIIQGSIVPIGRISWQPIQEAIRKALTA